MEQEIPPSNTVSSQASLPSSHDAGWNDPPKWALSGQTEDGSTFTSTKKILNKRVAFPLDAQSSLEKVDSLDTSKTPPILHSAVASTITSAPHKPLVAPVDKNPPATLLDDFDRNQALIEAVTNLGTVITEQRMEKSKAEEILRRLNIMKSDWHEDKLNDTVERGILDISKALIERDVKKADKIHIALVTQHAAVCHTWIPAIRLIIFELKKTCEKFDISKLEHLQSSIEQEN